MKRILFVAGLPSSLVNFRGPLLKAMLAQGHKVFTVANGRDSDTEIKLRAMGVEYYPVRVARAGMNPMVDLIALFDLIRVMRYVKPDVILSYTIKPIIFGGLAARFCRVGSIYSLVTGLGYAFMDAASSWQRMMGWLAKSLYCLSLRYSCRVFFQNPDDERVFVEMGIVSQDRAVVVNGSGVDLATFSFSEFRQEGHFLEVPLRFLLIARLLKDKGINEYAEAARIIKRKYLQAEFHLVGTFDPNPSGLKPEVIRAWEDEGLIKFHGEQRDVRPFIRNCHVYVLPSYREGTPRSVLEAMAIGRAVITTDAPGCRETVIWLGGDSAWKMEEGAKNFKIGRNGVLVPVKNVVVLSSAMEFFFEHPEQVAIMGRAGRHYAEERYDVHKVDAVMLREMGLGIAR